MFRRVISIVVLLLAPVAANAAGSHDISLWGKSSPSGTKLFPWYAYTADRFALDIRYNVDGHDATTWFIGIPLRAGSTTVTAHVGVIMGDEFGPSAQVNVATGHGKLSVFSLNQWADLTRAEGSSSYTVLYHYGAVGARLHQRLSLGIGEQVYHESHSSASVDLGPTLTLHPGHGVYVRFWVTASPTDSGTHKGYIGLGYAP